MSGQSDEQHMEFPSEEGWLDLTPPDISPDFVDRTLASLRQADLLADAGADRPDTAASAPHDVAAEVLAEHQVPPVSEGFVDKTLARISQDREDKWRRTLLRYEAPEPTPAFVERTLAALKTEEPSGRVIPGRFTRRMTLATTAAALLVFLSWPQNPASPMSDMMTSAPSGLAWSHSPSALSHLLPATAHSVNVRNPHMGGQLHTAPDPAMLWLTNGGDQ
ncbi:MAG: hypothetical protein VYE77_04815 [Planctomycetota bacterium]|nr:hypothetical protein [Planctomycetota bacterium]